MTAFFTRHAGIRVYRRLSMSHVEVGELLNNDRAVNVGVDRARRAHRLFFSARDRRWFVAVQSEQNGVVVTVWPLRFHERLDWRIAPHALHMARALATGEELRPLEASELERAVRRMPRRPAHTLRPHRRARDRRYRRECAARRARDSTTQPWPSA